MAKETKNKREMTAVINHSGSVVRFEIAVGSTHEPIDEHELAPGEIVEIDSAYARKYSSKADRDPRPSTIDLMTNGKVIAIDDPRVVEHPKVKAYIEKQAAREAQRSKAKSEEKRI